MQGLIAKGTVATKEAPLQSLSITNCSILTTFLSIPSCITWLIYAPSRLQKLASTAHWFTYMNEEYASDLSIQGPTVSSQNDLRPTKLFEFGMKYK